MVNLEKRNINKKWLISLMVIIFGCFLVSETTQAGGDSVDLLKGGSLFGGWILGGINSILYGIFKLTLMLLAGSMWLLNTMISPEMFSGVFFSTIAKEGINTAWSFVRDFFNLFFILIIVLVGLSTILGVSKFKDKAVLMRVIIAAMLINFSKPLTLFIIDISQVFMRFFADAIDQMDFTAKLQNLINFNTILSSGDLGDNFAYFVIIITVILMTLIIAIILFYLAISLIIRMISFWVLIILSPLAMFGFAMEGTKFGSMKDDWVKNLMSWCFYGPVLLFFFWLALILVDALIGATKAGVDVFSPMNAEQVRAGSGALSNFAVKVFSLLIPYITVIYLLFYGYYQAKKTSSGMASKILVAGNKKVSDWGNKAKKLGYGAARMTTIPGRAEAMKEGLKHGIENDPLLKRFTKKGAEDIQAKRNAKAKEVYGGDGGAATRDYNRGKAQEKLKKWKENPPEKDEIKTAFNSKDRTERLAATLYKAQNNQLGFEEDGTNSYAVAMKALEKDGDKQTQQQITREAGKENMGAVVNYEMQKKIEKEQKPGGVLEGLSIMDQVYNDREENISSELYKKKLGKKNLKDIFKNQQQSFYLDENGNLRPGVLKFLHDKALTKSGPEGKISRKKFADELGDDAVIEAIRKAGNEGEYILGEA